MIKNIEALSPNIGRPCPKTKKSIVGLYIVGFGYYEYLNPIIIMHSYLISNAG
jgi:hypothetical protein